MFLLWGSETIYVYNYDTFRIQKSTTEVANGTNWFLFVVKNDFYTLFSGLKSDLCMRVYINIFTAHIQIYCISSGYGKQWNSMFLRVTVFQTWISTWDMLSTYVVLLNAIPDELLEISDLMFSAEFGIILRRSFHVIRVWIPDS